MASINPNMGSITSNFSVRSPGTGSLSTPTETPASPPGDALNVDFSKTSSAAPKAESVYQLGNKIAQTFLENPFGQLGGMLGSVMGLGGFAASDPANPYLVGLSAHTHFGVGEQPPAAPESGLQAAATRENLSLSNSGGLAQLDSPLVTSDFSSDIDGCLAKLAGTSDTKEVRTITAGQVDWDKGADVTSNARKFIMPVPNFEGEPLIYPDGAKDKDGNSIAGTPIKDWQGQPIGDKGVVFFNPKDQSWQAVKSDGQGVVIMNQMTEEQGKALMDKVGGDPMNMSLGQFKEFLSFASSEVGCKDMYNSDRGFIEKKMNAIESSPSGFPQFGMFRRDDQDVCKALFTKGPAEFDAPTTGGILVKLQIPEEGGVLLRQPDGKGFLFRKIDNEVFEETYKNKDGTQVSVGDLPRHGE